jgi:DNA-binding transcriptional LysR family regulator
MKIDLNQLESLKAVVECGSFAKAAVRMNKVRSAVSYDIRCLEEQLGVPLLDRSGYRSGLTEAGEMILREGRQLLLQARAIEHLADMMGQECEPSVKMVTEGAIPMKPVMRAIKGFSERNLPTLIELRTEILGGVLSRFEREKADLMLVKDFDAPLDEYVVDHLPNIRCVLVASTSHPLFEGNPDVVHSYQIREHLELNIQSSSEGRLEMYDHRLGGTRVLNLGGFYDKKEALLMGLGFGWMPRGLVAEELAGGQLAVVPYADGSTFEFTPSLMHRKDRPLGRSASLFRQLLLTEFSEL